MGKEKTYPNQWKDFWGTEVVLGISIKKELRNYTIYVYKVKLECYETWNDSSFTYY